MNGIGEHKGEQGKIKNLEGEKRSKTGSDIDFFRIDLLSFIKLIELYEKQNIFKSLELYLLLRTKKEYI
jgi:hypothetical protein